MKIYTNIGEDHRLGYALILIITKYLRQEFPKARMTGFAHPNYIISIEQNEKIAPIFSFLGVDFDENEIKITHSVDLKAFQDMRYTFVSWGDFVSYICVPSKRPSKLTIGSHEVIFDFNKKQFKFPNGLVLSREDVQELHKQL